MTLLVAAEPLRVGLRLPPPRPKGWQAMCQQAEASGGSSGLAVNCPLLHSELGRQSVSSPCSISRLHPLPRESSMEFQTVIVRDKSGRTLTGSLFFLRSPIEN